MDIRQLLSPYTSELSETQIGQVVAYVDLLLRWNAKMNLTAIREPKEIVRRHFGESFYLARHLPLGTNGVIDIGSGAGFPGIPVKIARPELTMTLVEAQQRKATFLREVLRTIGLQAEVRNARVEEVVRSGGVQADLVTMRAVEKFETILPMAAKLVRPTSEGIRSGVLALLIGTSQLLRAKELLPQWQFSPEIPIPAAQKRVILLGNQVGK